MGLFLDMCTTEIRKVLELHKNEVNVVAYYFRTNSSVFFVAFSHLTSHLTVKWENATKKKCDTVKWENATKKTELVVRK